MTTKLTQRQKDKLIEAAQNSIEFTVEGKRDFPLDMLRYDLCRPATESDSTLINTTIVFPYVSGRKDKPTFTIRLKGLKPPTVARWHSFGWAVLPPEDYR